MTPAVERIAKIVCEAAQGRDACTCRDGRACDVWIDQVDRIGVVLGVTRDQMADLAVGALVLRCKPGVKP